MDEGLSLDLSEDLDALLCTVDLGRAEQAKTILACIEPDHTIASVPSFRCAASWITRTDPRKSARVGPRHQTLRRRGKAPSYPRPIDLTRGRPGTIELRESAIALIPDGKDTETLLITASNIRRISFYADCIEIVHGKAQHTLVQCKAVDQLDLFLEAFC